MSEIKSDVTGLPQSCKAAAERTAAFLTEEDRYADISESCRQKITELEQEIGSITGEKVALVAYHI